MLPRITHEQTLEPQYLAYLDALKAAAFRGDIDASYAARLVQATDNSVYQFLPQAVLYPKDIEDIQLALSLASQEAFLSVVFSARGGGTGTNGQSLTHGIILDLSRYMNRIIEVNVEQGWALVEAGVVKDQLNDALRPHGYFFSPDLSTSNRATLGGMINTDASGAGSLVYGKTSDHVLELSSVLADGTLLNTAPLGKQALASVKAELAHVATGDNEHSALSGSQILHNIATATLAQRDEIEARFPPLNRFLTGYDLKHVWDGQLTTFDLSRILTGSEGTLAVICRAKLNLTPLPASRTMVNIKYDSFESALRHAPALVEAKATVVETIDSTVLNLAREDIIWHSVAPLISDVAGQTIMGLNMVEFAGDVGEVMQRLQALEQRLNHDITQQHCGVLGYQITDDAVSISRIYAMRKKAVGLLGATKGRRKPLAFAEDTAVPPEQLADFIMDFRQLLDSKQLRYGMFGHVDAGVLHVRPALDMCDPADEQLLRQLSDEVAALTAKYGGLMWGEHGKGVRGEYAPAVFGETLYGLLRDIKTWFDPHNKLNPGKLVAPRDQQLCYDVDSQKRGGFDRQIPVTVREAFPDAMNCNGNGLCFNYSQYSPMCPSFKVTGDRIHSPKGRAGLMREWLRLLARQQIEPLALQQASPVSWMTRLRNSYRADKEYDFSHEVMASLQGCLACKACSGQCPVKVDVPRFRAQFYQAYYQRYLRPAKDYLVAGLEESLPLMAATPRLTNLLTDSTPVRWGMKRLLGYVDAPLLSVPTLKQQLANHSCLGYELTDLQQIAPQARQQYVLVVQDPFNSFYDANLVANFIRLIETLGLKPVLLPFKPNGKPAHIKGFLAKFARQAKDSAAFFCQLQQLGIPMVGVDPALVLVYRDEYRHVLPASAQCFDIKLVNEWLLKQLVDVPARPASGRQYTWFSHCTESSANPTTGTQWQKIFTHLGASLNTAQLGCCGMAGTYGHEAENLARSKALYKMSWADQIAALPREEILVSGYSCRSQVKRLSRFRPKHPLEAILTLLSE